MLELINEYTQAKQEEIIIFDSIADRELDIILQRAELYGKCLFRVRDDLIRIYPVEEV